MVEVAAAVITDGEGRILLGKRPPQKRHGGLWELPGGKKEKNERLEEALVREIKEELDLDVVPVRYAGSSKGSGVVLHAWHVRRAEGQEPVNLEHTETAWVRPADFPDYPMPAGDRELLAVIFGRAD